jgi:hypothetical protein
MNAAFEKAELPADANLKEEAVIRVETSFYIKSHSH